MVVHSTRSYVMNVGIFLENRYLSDAGLKAKVVYNASNNEIHINSVNLWKFMFKFDTTYLFNKVKKFLQMEMSTMRDINRERVQELAQIDERFKSVLNLNNTQFDKFCNDTHLDLQYNLNYRSLQTPHAKVPQSMQKEFKALNLKPPQSAYHSYGRMKKWYRNEYLRNTN